MKVLVVTNDFPPRPGGIQAFVHSLASRLDPDEVVVYASDWSGSAAFDVARRAARTATDDEREKHERE